MDINVHVAIPALDRLVDAILSGASPTAIAAATKDKPVRAERAEPKADKPAAEKAEKPAQTEKPKADAGEASSGDLFNDVKKAAQTLSMKKGRDKVASVLEEFGASSLSGVPAERHAEFLARCNEELEA